jgi:hypothetical protein
VRALLLLADAARAHGDGTFSLLRGGIDRVLFDTLPAALRASLVARITGDQQEDVGAHSIRIRLVGADGGERFHSPPHQIQVPAVGGNNVLVVELGVEFPARGRYTFELRVDDQLLNSWHLDVVPRTEATARPTT